MSPELFQLKRIKDISLDQKQLGSEMKKLSSLTLGWDQLAGIESPDLLEDLRRRMRTGKRRNEKFDEYTAVKRRESLLLAVYLNDLGDTLSAGWLPAFDKKVGISILGNDPRSLKKHLRRLATQLYFVHFGVERLPCLDWLADLLNRSWSGAAGERHADPASLAWMAHADALFGVDAPDKVVSKWDGSGGADELADQFHIHDNSLFRERLFESLILKQLQETSHKCVLPELDGMVTATKHRRLRNGHPLGAEAVKILVTRARLEFKSRVPDAWREKIVSYACDPRVINTVEKAKWWGWASRVDIDIAIRSLSEISLHEFIKLLDQSLRGTGLQHQFRERRDLLLKLFELGKVIEARLVVHDALYRSMSPQLRALLRPSRVNGGRQQTSFICLRCSDDVFLIEGTHSFAIRGFIGDNSFPIVDFWASGSRLYQDSQLRVSEDDCPIYQRHHNGDWVWDFNCQLRAKRIEWRLRD
jgi:hypothetical protein